MKLADGTQIEILCQQRLGRFEELVDSLLHLRIVASVRSRCVGERDVELGTARKVVEGSKELLSRGVVLLFDFLAGAGHEDIAACDDVDEIFSDRGQTCFGGESGVVVGQPDVDEIFLRRI